MRKDYLYYLYDLPDKTSSWFSRGKGEVVSDSEYTVKLRDKNELQRAILNESSSEVQGFVSEHLDLARNYQSILFSSKDKSYTDNVDFNNIRAIVNFRPINEIKHVNEHFCSVNKLLPDSGIYIGRVETYWERKIRIFNKYGKQLGQILWILDFLINRVFAKLRPFDKIYKAFTRNRVSPKSQAEILGRLVYCGFEVIEFTVIDNLFYFVVIKTGEPMRVKEPTYHALVKLNRVGKDGKMIRVYKFRTMHPYSEFLQDYVVKLYGYNDVGKPAYDFRLARWGKFFRKLWIDELPQIFNLLKGEMKLVGVRPLSLARFREFPKDMQVARLKYKPGCFPPYVALNMPDEYGNIEAERIYLADKEKAPITTDLVYFFRALSNILLNKIRSS